MRAMGRLFLIVLVCGTLVAALTIGPELALAYRTVSYVFGTLDPPNDSYDVTFGTEVSEELRGGPGNDLLASEGPWGTWPEDYKPDLLYGGSGDDYLDTVSWPSSSADTLNCGPGEDVVVADPQDDVDDDCENVKRVSLSLVPHIGDPLPEFPPENMMRRYGSNSQAEMAPE